jgi:hypothetical protein
MQTELGGECDRARIAIGWSKGGRTRRDRCATKERPNLSDAISGNQDLKCPYLAGILDAVVQVIREMSCSRSDPLMELPATDLVPVLLGSLELD